MASEKDTPMNTVSKIMSKALDLEGISSYGILLSKNQILVLDFLASLTNTHQIFHGGSIAEGTFSAGSDADCMVVLSDITVQTVQINPERVRGLIFLLDTSCSRPGFGRLRLVYLDHTEQQLSSGCNANFREMLKDTDDGTYLSSEKFVNFYVSNDGSEKLGVSSQYRHGPCATAEHQDVHGFIMGKPGINVELDMVHALQCDQWPVEAKEWMTRKRLHNWPTEEVVDKISLQKCHAVPIGDARSGFFSVEWRISFLLGERELVWNFNNIQVQCYVILKKILKKYIEPLVPNQLSSYHMKTIMFWLSEEKGLSVWYDENLLQCVAESLGMLKSCIVKGELQHYFHRQRNLLTCKLEDVSEKEFVLTKIDEIQEDIVTHALKCLDEWEGLSEEWTFCNGNITKFMEEIKRVPELYDGYARRQMVHDLIKLSRVMFGIYLSILGEHHPFEILHKRIACEHLPKDVMPLFRAITQILLDLRCGIAYFRHVIDCKDELCQKYIQTKSLTLEHAVQFISHAQHIDSMSGVLYFASLCFFQGQFSASNDIVLSVLKQNKNLIYSGRCSRNICIQLTLEGKTQQGSDIHFGGNEGGVERAYDVLFTLHDLHFVPCPVKFECASVQYDKESFCVIHPCVYAYFLLCIGQHCVGGGAPFQDFLSQLEETVRETIGGLQRYRALNLLGFCYVLDGNLKEAFRCFSESLEETRDFPLVLNAAVYHIGILIVHVLEAKEKEDDVVYKRK